MGTSLKRVAQRNILPAACSYLTMPDPELTGLLALGKALNRVAAALSIKLRTVRTHRVNILRKPNPHGLAESIECIFSLQIVYVHSIPILQMACSEPPWRFDFDEDLAKAKGKSNG
jgi:DNA-binding CsgD family transcriptional regulator